MNPTRTTNVMHALWRLVVAGAIAVLVAGAGLSQAHAQNAAQRAALARLRGVPAIAPANGVEATTTPLYLPTGLAFDSAGNLYVADTNNDVIREVSVEGIISTVAGNGDQGFGGDGSTATSAQLDSPVGIAVDSTGNLYIADSHNNRIRKVSGGVIQTIAGTGVAGFGGDGGAATSAELDLPTAVAVDSAGNIYIADTNNNRIRKIAGTTITTVAGNGEQTYSGDGGAATAAGLDSPMGIAVDGSMNLYIGDTHNQRVRMVTASTGMISTLAGTGSVGFSGDGAAATATLARPRGVAVDGTGTVYVADSDNNRIRSVNGGTITTLVGDGTQGMSGDGGTPTTTSLNTPDTVALNGSTLGVSDTGNQRVLEVQNSTLNTVAGQGNGSESLSISGPLSVVYGTGALTATFKNGTNIATGNVTFYDNAGSGPVAILTAPLSSDVATLSTAMLAAGTHSITAYYSGDANDPAMTSGVYVLAITPAQLTAVANAVNLFYGQTIPALSGSLAGVLPQDVGKVAAAFASVATSTSAPGNYPITVALSGSAASNYTVVLGGGSGLVMIAKAPTQTTLSASSSSSILGSSITFTASVASTTTGMPTGTVSFFSGTTLLNTTPASLTNGAAKVKLTTLNLGGQSITAVYNGDTDFAVSTSNALQETVIPSPDFTITASPTSQSVLAGSSASYTLSLTPVNSTFVNAVNLSVSGLPAGDTATFTPSSIAVGASASTSTMVITTSKKSALVNSESGNLPLSPALALLFVPLAFTRRFRRNAARLSRGTRWLALLVLLAVLSGLSACGGHVSYTKTTLVTVTAVGGSVTHTTVVALSVQ